MVRGSIFVLCLLLLLSACISSAPAANLPEEGAVAFYVDAIKGNDASDGSSQEKAVKSLKASLALIAKAPADKRVILNMARGSVWREDLPAKDLADYTKLIYTQARPNLTLRPYGKGDKPTISGLDILQSDKFTQADKANYPHIWSQKVKPPISFDFERQGLIVDGKKPLQSVRIPFKSPVGKDVFQTVAFKDVQTEADAMAYVEANPGSFYVKDLGEGQYEVFINSGSDPTKDKLSYEYKVRGSPFMAQPWNRWEDIRFIGLNNRNGIAAGGGEPHWVSWKGVEILYGATHNLLILGYRLEDCLAVGYPTNGDHAAAASGFHAHNPSGKEPAQYGVLYDKCRAQDVGNAFYDHAKNDRPWVYLRDCVTDSVSTVLNHGNGDTRRGFIVGHRHNAPTEQKATTPSGAIGYLVIGRDNQVEDSIFHVFSRGGWHPATLKARMRNCVVYTRPAVTEPGVRPIAFQNMEGIDHEYEYCTFIMDFKGQDINPKHPANSDRLAMSIGKNSGTVKYKNCVIAVIGAPNMMTAAGKPGLPMLFSGFPAEMTFENCVLTYIADVPEGAGKAGTDYEFVVPESLFAGDPAKGNYAFKADSAAAKRDAGYKSGRKPVFRLEADKLAAELPK